MWKNVMTAKAGIQDPTTWIIRVPAFAGAAY